MTFLEDFRFALREAVSPERLAEYDDRRRIGSDLVIRNGPAQPVIAV